ncbi:Fe-S biogenesis protein NfuA [Zooshikella harenae]|uniref:Fe/S biogenesis protein NfuA n=1 Tax=Zooshikella harenae TaxID=2827238 RepID=A0ABS5Z9M8_9GAMM|nr:Fe-S biogenesis protein NfuA [Zooshikella harenae]MBU2710754.1 Fe-S biogenesis protein NfuA [Zooshikella harenae]
MNIKVTESAQDYLAELLAKQEVEGIGIRIFITQPGTPYAETCIAYCKPDEKQEGDIEMPLKAFSAWIEGDSEPYLEEAEVDYATDRFGGQLTIKAPNAKVPRISEDSPLNERINYILITEINPGLAAHGGRVELIEIVDDVAILQFGGGCQGCGMVDLTLKEGIEKTLLERIPELKGVRDVTDHSDTTQAYY